jgi:hypothetical protein
MLAEWITHLRTPCPQPYRRMGYLKELIAIDQRHRRCRSAWTPHLETSRKLITDAADTCPEKGRVVVLGSGLLLDIPVHHLAATFREVVLFDICHLRSTREAMETFTNVRLVEGDISGAAGPLDRWLSGDRRDGLPNPEIDKGLIGDADYVISSNLLAQLPLTPLNHLEKRAHGLNDTDREQFARSIIDHHLGLLQSLDCPVTLITETLRLITDDDRPLNKIDPLFGAPLYYEGEEWWWQVAPRPEISRNFDMRLAVRGIANLNDATQARFCRNTTLAAP